MVEKTDVFSAKNAGSLLVEFEKEGIRKVSRAGWITELDVVSGIVLISISPVMKVEKGIISRVEDGIVTVGIEECKLFGDKKETHVAGEKFKHFSIYASWWLTRSNLSGEEALRRYIEDIKNALTIIRDCARWQTV